nr:hypothetical protein BJQ95_02686 [Cryobacterium sp. SO1]
MWLLDAGNGLDVCGHVTGEGDHGGRAGVHALRGHRDGGLAQQLVGVALLRGQHDGDHVTGAAGPGGAARAVQVRLVLCGRVHVDDELDVVDVHATGGDVGGDEHLHIAGAERGEVAVTGHLGQVAVQVDGGDAGIRQRLGQLLGVVLGAHEQDATAGARSELLDELLLGLGGVDLEHVVGHRGDVAGGLVDRVQNLVVQEPAHDLVHAVVERGGEQQALAAGRGLVQDARHDGQEAQVGHVVGLVEHGDLDGVEVHEALLHEVFETAGAGHDDVDAGLERGDLAVLRDAAEDGGGVQAVGLGKRGERCGDLGGQLAGRCEDQAERAARAALAAGELAAEAGHHRDGEREGLSGAGLTAAQDVAALEGVGQGVDLDRERAVDALRGEHGNEGSGHAKRAKGSFRQSGAFRGISLLARTGDARSDGRSQEDSHGEGADGHIRSP